MLQSNGEGLLGAIEKLLDSVYIPALSQCERWGDLTEADARHVKLTVSCKAQLICSCAVQCSSKHS